jgi:hypothetical protein
LLRCIPELHSVSERKYSHQSCNKRQKIGKWGDDPGFASCFKRANWNARTKCNLLLLNTICTL